MKAPCRQASTLTIAARIGQYQRLLATRQLACWMEQHCDIWLRGRLHRLLVARGCRLDAVKVERGANELVWAGEGEADSSAGDVGPVRGES
jgi:hypothetical protein